MSTEKEETFNALTAAALIDRFASLLNKHLDTPFISSD